ncbi:MAG: hypothetical protein Q7K57_49975 [Burkholderiaceae bacterium]|nr:hypothetical protein [Burkholderiaceae bacterium]
MFKQTFKQPRGWIAGAVLVAVLALSACGSGSSTGSDTAANTTNTTETLAATDGSGTTTATTGSGTGTAGTGASGTGTTGTTGSGTGTGTGTSTTSTGTTGTGTGTSGSTGSGTVSAEVYTITVYYTAVESFHTDAAQTVSGCLIRECSFGNSVIGSYPASFIKATKTEGTGRITSGANAGKYLNWSVDVGYWLDTIPSDGYGGALVPFRTAAADDIALTRGTQFMLVAPLMQEDGSALDSTSANRFLAAQWLVNDQFTPGLGGALHLDLYIGEEDRANFTSSPMYTTLANVKIARL